MPDKKGQNLADLIYGQDSIRPTEVKRPAALGLGQALQRGHEFVSKPFGYPNPPAEAISEFLGVPAIARTLERLGYGEPLTTGRGMTTKPKEDTVEALLSVAPLAPATKGMPVGAVIKPKGGNWLTGNVEKALSSYKKEGLTPEEVQELRARPPSLITTSMLQPERVLSSSDVALNNWIDRNLANYVKKEMATPEDPVRRLAEQGVNPQGRFQYNPERNLSYLEIAREELGYPPKGMGQSPQAKNWERIADEATQVETAGDIIAKARGDDKEWFKDFDTKKYQNILKENPWLLKVDPSTPVYSPKSGPWSFGDTGFDHIIDVLREDLATGRIRPEQLSKVSMEQAVRRTYEYDQELAKKMAEATAAARADLPVYKEYPEKYRWIELNRPGAFASESEAMGHSVRGYEPPKGHPDWSPASGDSGSPSYGHGGWEAIKSGKAKVYSLVDEKGQPHVTVEVGKPIVDRRNWFFNQPDEIVQQIHSQAGSNPSAKQMDALIAAHPKYQQDVAATPDRITQIKGKQNAAPKEEYLPFVQDFVKSGQWSDVGDLRNTGLFKVTPGQRLPGFSKEIDPGYYTIDEFKRMAAENEMPQDILDSWMSKLESQSRYGYKHGGPVHISNNPDTMRLELAGGGTLSKVAMEALSKAKLLREEMAAKAALQAQYAKQMEGVYTKDMPTFEQWKATQEPQKAAGGGVDRLTPQDMLYLTSHPDFAKMSAQQQREAVVNMGDRELSERLKGKMAGGGTISKLAKLLRAPAKTKQEIEAIAERMAPQVTGEYVREKPGSAVTIAGKTAKQFEREKNLPMDIRVTSVERKPEKVDIEKLKDQVAIGIAGDPTVTGKTLYGVGETRLASPAPQHGGPLYGLYHDQDHFWASGLGAARRVQNLAKEASQQYDAPVLGKYVMMGPESINYAQHFADANLQAIDLSKMTAKQVEGFNNLLRKGSPASGPRPSFPGIEDKESAYLQMAFDPELRKHFNQLMQQPTVTEKFGLPSGQDIRFAITEPELRNLERGVTGYSMGRMKPEVEAKALKLSEHPTYSHDIPGEFMGQTKYPIPYELSFPDTLKAIRENPKQAPHEFGSLKMVGPRQIIDQQLIDEIKAYEDRMKALTGKKKGGSVKKADGGEVTVPDMTDGGKVIDGGPFKKGGKVQFTDNLDTMRLAVGRK